MEPDFFPDIALTTAINSRQNTRLSISRVALDCLPATSVNRVAAKFARIRVSVMARRNQRSEVSNESRVVMNMAYLLDDGVDGFRYGHDARVRNGYQREDLQTLYNQFPSLS
jgi:hypothetical protein